VHLVRVRVRVRARVRVRVRVRVSWEVRTSHCGVQKMSERPSGDHCTCASCILSSLPHSRLPSTEPTMTAPSS